MANYVEFSVTYPFEGAAVDVTEDGIVRMGTGAGQQRQGYETVFAQVCADVFDLPVDRVVVIAGDTAAIKVAGEHLRTRPEQLRWPAGAFTPGVESG